MNTCRQSENPGGAGEDDGTIVVARLTVGVGAYLGNAVVVLTLSTYTTPRAEALHGPEGRVFVHSVRAEYASDEGRGPTRGHYLTRSDSLIPRQRRQLNWRAAARGQTSTLDPQKWPDRPHVAPPSTSPASSRETAEAVLSPAGSARVSATGRRGPHLRGRILS